MFFGNLNYVINIYIGTYENCVVIYFLCKTDERIYMKIKIGGAYT